jgi:hypothetical protein
MPRPACVSAWMLLTACGISFAARPASADEAAKPPLHERIDRLIEQGTVGPSAAICSDADFVRRVWLDLAGMIPPVTEVRSFLADEAPDKRIKLIDRLLASAEFNRHMALLWDATINERRADKGVTSADWQGYLYQSLAANKPLDQLLREILVSDGVEPALRPAAKFMLDRDCEPNVVTRDLGRLLFGMDLQCAQCHDHPLVDDYYQADYYGLYAFVMRSSVFADPKNKQSRQIGEAADGEASFKSVFTGNTGDKVQPRTPKWVGIVEPVVKKGEEYVSKPAKDVRGVPKVSRRQLLAGEFENSLAFRRNIANRLWAQVMGRGLVHPVDAHHPANPPAHPEVLTLLTEEVKTLKYDMRAAIRELMLTKVYQRTCELPAPDVAAAASREQEFAQQLMQFEAQRAELVTARDQKKSVVDESVSKITDARMRLAEAAKTLAPLQTALTTAQAEVAKAQAAVTAAQKDIETKKTQSAAITLAATKAKEAAELIKDDKVLAEAATKLAERAKVATDAESAANKKVTELTAAVEPAQKKAADAQAALDKESAGFPTPQQIVELEVAERSAGFAFNESIYAVAEIDARVTLVKLLKQHAELQKNGDIAGAQRLWGQLIEELANRGQVALLKPLSAEQFALSAMQATGFIVAQQQSAEAALVKAAPEEWKKASDAEKPLVMQKLREPKVFDNVKGQLAEFIRLYGGLPGQDYQATVNQALFFGNGSVLDTWLKPTAGNLIARLQEKKEPTELADELYLAVFSRAATPDEQTAVTNFLKDREADKAVALAELAWALLASTEFRFNH